MVADPNAASFARLPPELSPEHAWASFEAVVIPPLASPAQRSAMRKAFMAGMFRAAATLHVAGMAVPPEDLRHLMAALRHECEVALDPPTPS